MTCGLNNIGATCYMNATIQAMAHCPKFVDTMANSDGGCEVTTQLRHLLSRMWNGSDCISPEDMLQALKEPMGKIGIHELRDVHDANELFMVISDSLCESSSALKRTLQGRSRWSTYCKDCTSLTFTPIEPFVTLNIDFTDLMAPHLLEDMIVRSFLGEQIGGYRCDSDSCKGGATDVTRTLQLWELPTVLTVTLKRFVYDGSVNRSEVSIPRTLNIRSTDEIVITYKLCSIVCHSGHSQYGGHYVTAARHAKGWYVYDDECKFKIDNRQRDSEQVRRSAYMLFYEVA